MQDKIASVHRLLRRLQQKNRFIKTVGPTGLTLVETFFLVELQADPSRSISELSELLQIDPSFGSRIANKLKTEKLIKMTPLEEDSRRKLLSLTPKATKLLCKNDSFADQAIAVLAQNISKAEKKLLTEGFKLIADGYGCPAGKRRANEDPYRVEQRRITRCFGLLGEHVFGSDLTSSKWQTLAEIVLAPVAPQITELAELLTVPQNSLSSIIAGLEKDQLIKREQHAEDRRISILFPTTAGKKTYKQIEKQATSDLERGLVKFSKPKFAKFVETLKKFIGETDAVYPPLLPQYSVVKHDSNAERKMLRAYAARTVVQQALEAEIPEQFISSESLVFSLNLDHKVCAVLEIEATTKQLAFAAWDKEISPWAMTGFVNKVDFLSDGIKPLQLASKIKYLPLRGYLNLQ